MLEVKDVLQIQNLVEQQGCQADFDSWNRIKKDMAVAQKTPTNKPSAKPCAWCRGRVANKGVFGNYCSECGFDLRTASHVD